MYLKQGGLREVLRYAGVREGPREERAERGCERLEKAVKCFNVAFDVGLHERFLALSRPSTYRRRGSLPDSSEQRYRHIHAQEG